MSDVSALSDDELLAQFKAAQMGGMTHTGKGDSQGMGALAIAGEDPTQGMSNFQRYAAGTVSGVENFARHAGNLVGYPNDADLKSWQQEQQPLGDTTAGKWGQFTGESVALAPLAMGGEAALGATAAGKALAARPFLGPLLKGMGTGGVQGAIMGDPGDKASSTKLGAAGGAVPALVGSAASKLANGISRTPTAQNLIDQGVRLSPGLQNPDSWWNKIEENMRGLPIVGNRIEKFRGQAWNDTQKAMIQEAAAPGSQLPKNMTDVNQLYQAASDSYKPLYDSARGFPVTPEIRSQTQNVPLSGAMQSQATRPGIGATQNVPLSGAMQSQATRPGIGATRQTRQAASDFIADQYQAFADKARSAGGWTSDHLIDMRSALSEEMRNANPDQDGMKYRKLLSGARDQITASLDSQLPSDAAANLKLANDSYPKLAILRDAIKAGGDKPTGFTPDQFSQAVKRSTDSGTYAAGGGLMRDMASDAKDIFTQRNPMTGMSLETLGPVGMAAAGAMKFPGVAIPAGAVGAGLTLTGPGQSLLRGTTPPQKLAQALSRAVTSATTPQGRAIAGATSRSTAADLARGLLLSKKKPGDQALALPAPPVAATGSGAP